MTDTCANCRFLLRTDSPLKGIDLLKCRRNPPQMYMAVHETMSFPTSGFPQVTETMWCGEFEAKDASGG